MSRIKRLSALEILDSRGRPTVQATCQLDDGAVATASVPSGASRGDAEAYELRDGDPKRYNGMGCLNAVANIEGEIKKSLTGRDFPTQQSLDKALIELDGTPNKSRLGGNAILAVSIAFARAQACQRQIPLYRHFADMLGSPIKFLPRPTVNLFSGGKHAGGQVPIQDVLIVPVAARSIDECLVTVSAVYQAAVQLIKRKYGMRWLTADEGGLAPPAESTESLLDDAMESIKSAGLTPGTEVSLAIDVASSHFYQDGKYHLGSDSLTSRQMIDRVLKWTDRYPIISLEDALSENDWAHWPILRSTVRPATLILGDDLLCTNPQRIRRAIDEKACNAILLKVNQIGTLTEAQQALNMARSANWHATISVRSGDTEDNWFSDLAVGWSGDQSKAGSITQSERLSKYNRLLAIESELKLPVIAPKI